MSQLMVVKADQKERAGFNQAIITRIKAERVEAQILDLLTDQVLQAALQGVHHLHRAHPVQGVVLIQESAQGNEKGY